MKINAVTPPAYIWHKDTLSSRMSTTQFTWHIYRGTTRILFTFGNRFTSCHATHSTYAACQKDLPVNIQHSKQITFPAQLCIVLYSFCACLLYSLIIWSNVSSLFPHDLTFWQERVRDICASGMTWWWWWWLEEIQFFSRYFPFRSHVQVFSYAISQVCCLKYPYSYFSSHSCSLFCFCYIRVKKRYTVK